MLISKNKLLLTLLFVSFMASVKSQWSTITNYPAGATDGCASFEINGDLYVGGGLGLQSLYRLDTASNTWSQMADIPGNVNRAWLFGFSIDGKGYMGGGDSTGSFTLKQDFYAYDPSSNSWTQKADFGAGPRDGAYACEVNGKGYVIGGFDGAAAVNQVWEYNPSSDQWTQKSNFPSGQCIFPAGFVIDDKIYVGTGSAGGSAGKQTFFEYDPATDNWDQKADFEGAARQAAVGFAVNGKGYLGGGQVDYTTIFTDFYTYDPEADTWAQDTSLTFPSGASMAWSTASAIGNKVYLGTGANFNGGTLNFSDKFYETAFVAKDTGTVDSSTSIPSAQNIPSVSIYPNPSSGTLHAQFRGVTSRTELTLYNEHGQLVNRSTIENTDRTVLSTDLPAGLYYVHVTNDQDTQVFPVIVQ